MDAGSRFSKQVLQSMRHDISDAGGNEVFWVGSINGDGIIDSVKVGSRGKEDEVAVNRALCREGNVLIHNHPSGHLVPSDNDMQIAAEYSQNSMGFYIVNNELTQVYVAVEPVAPKVIVPLNAKDAAFYLSEGGPLSSQSEFFEERPSQIELVKAIAEAFNREQIAVFEAGTGVGKSYAYLIPSMLWAYQNKERIVISTGTINLQQQLMEKDVPAAIKILGMEGKIKAVLVKGRQNYVCLRRLSDASGERELFSNDTEIFDSICEWVKTTSSGSRSDLSFMPSDSVWSRINSESDACMGSRCPNHEKCFVMKVRKEAMDANIIIVNHHLLFADLESRMNGAGYDDAAVLPPYRRIIFDEAHGIEDSATSFFSEELNRFKVNKQLNLMYRQKFSSVAGFLIQIMALSSCDDKLAEANSLIASVKQNLVNLDETALDFLQDRRTVRIEEQHAREADRVFYAMEKFRSSLALFDALVHEVIEGISDADIDTPCVWEAKTVLRRLEDMIVFCKDFLSWNEKQDTVFWMQRQLLSSKKYGEEPVWFVQFFQTPLDIAPLMNAGVYEPMQTVVCTSATLKTGKDFSYWMRRTGASFVDGERLVTGEFASPFPYKTNVLFAVPDDAPLAKSFEYQSYVEQAVPSLILAAGGRTLVLFTSYDSLRRTYESARLNLRDSGFTILKQGDDDRFRLLELFKNDRTSVLFATDSFWEGVDVPGESLSQVIIVKLPFAVPDDPVFAARSDAVEKRGGSAFFELSVPQAVMKFRQGFGRLMRRSDDRGCIVVLDRRIIEMSYGKSFTQSVPATQKMYNPLREIISAVTDFLSR